MNRSERCIHRDYVCCHSDAPSICNSVPCVSTTCCIHVAYCCTCSHLYVAVYFAVSSHPPHPYIPFDAQHDCIRLLSPPPPFHSEQSAVFLPFCRPIPGIATNACTVQRFRWSPIMTIIIGRMRNAVRPLDGWQRGPLHCVGSQPVSPCLRFLLLANADSLKSLIVVSLQLSLLWHRVLWVCARVTNITQSALALTYCLFVCTAFARILCACICSFEARCASINSASAVLFFAVSCEC